jgi:GntR family transcriptional regulator, trigonelline degradation regulator
MDRKGCINGLPIVPYYENMRQSSPQSASALSLGTISKAAAPLRRQVLLELRQSIISGRLIPGERLVERELISMMGVSRTVIREALRQLESEGLVAIIPNKGPVVRKLTLEEAQDLYAIRAVLEGLAARLFTQHADETQVDQLDTALHGVAEAFAMGDPERILETKNTFYDVLFAGARSQTLSSMIGMLHGRIRRWRAIGLSHPQRAVERQQESIRNLRVMLKAVRARDARLAEQAIREDVQKAAAEINRLLGKESPQ